MANKDSVKNNLKVSGIAISETNVIGEKSVFRKIADILIPVIIIALIVISGLFILKNKYENQILVSELKIAYSVLTQGLSNAVLEKEEEDITTTPLWIACNIKTIDNNITQCENEIKKYFIIKRLIKHSDNKNGTISNREECKNLVGKYNKWWYLNSNNYCSGWNNVTFILNSGMRVDMLAIGKNDSYIVGQLTVDVNGSREPNRWGRDAFMFNITRDGSLMPYGGRRDCKRLAEYLDVDLDNVLLQRHWQYTDICSKTTTSDGTACAARIIENNWKMDY